MATLDIARRRMRASRLTGAPFTAPDEAVRWHCAMQAQDYGPAKWSIGQRAARVRDDEIDRALHSGSIVRTHVLRPTWHFVARDDVRWLLALTGPRVQRSIGSRYRELGLDGRTLDRCEARIVSALEGGRRLTREDIAGILDDARIDRTGQRLPFILMHCELEAVICSGGRRGKQLTYALLDERVPRGGRFDRDEALAELVHRYLASHGPATIKDLRWWSSLTAADIRQALEALGPRVQSDAIDGITFWFLTEDSGRATRRRGAHLLQAYDELIVGYTESRFFGDPIGARARAVWRDRRLPSGVLLLDDRVGGHWRRTIGKHGVSVEILTYEEPSPDEVHRLESAA
ncbi:MAG: winged helix DNA-binding domain-containing protein, partial [Actinomycetota bacterium]|nr:winged helix DNA-binding domain-containing protein [Actinomycetota bacterium]